MTATVIAVLGTLLGSVVSGLLQHRAASAVRSEAREDEQRTAQLDAVTLLAVSVSDHRRAMWDVRYAGFNGADPARIAELRNEMRGTRSAITGPAVRVRLLVPDARVRAAAQEAVQTTYRMRDAADSEELQELRTAALAAHDDFIDCAGRWIAAS